MSREIRKVPPNWQHPKVEYEERLQPMFDERYEDAFDEWLKEFDAARAGKDRYYATLNEWVPNNPPPDPLYYRPWKDDEATWLQLWETVSEGTPITPPFATKEELVDYLVEHGDWWKYRWTRNAAENMVKSEWAASAIFSPEKGYQLPNEYMAND